MKYHKGSIENGNFEICVAVTGLQSCGSGYDGPEKEPVYVRVSLQGAVGDPTPMILDNGNSQAQSSSNNNENNNALSQSQETKIYICNDKGCNVQ